MYNFKLIDDYVTIIKYYSLFLKLQSKNSLARWHFVVNSSFYFNAHARYDMSELPTFNFSITQITVRETR